MNTPTTGKALLITGPSGSGKSALGQRLAESLGWAYLSEDDYWVRNGWGDELRSEDREKAIQGQVLNDVLSEAQKGRNAVVEFLLFKRPPNPLTSYREMLARQAISYGTIVLKPKVDEIIKKVEGRGRPIDIEDMDRKRKEAAEQVEVLHPDYIDPDWIIDPTGSTIDALASVCLARMREQQLI